MAKLDADAKHMAFDVVWEPGQTGDPAKDKAILDAYDDPLPAASEAAPAPAAAEKAAPEAAAPPATSPQAASDTATAPDSAGSGDFSTTPALALIPRSA